MTDANPRAVIGANFPPTEPAELRLFLEHEHAELVNRKDALLASAAELAGPVNSDQENADFGDQAKQIQRAILAVESTRKAAKEPILTAARTLDGFFQNITTPLETAKKRLEAAQGVFLRAKADRARRAAEEAARIAREEQQRLEREAAEAEARRIAEAAAKEPPKLWDAKPKERDEAGEFLTQAVEQETQARAAERLAVAKPADLVRSRSGAGVVSTLVKSWNFRVVDPSAVPREFLTVDPSLIRSKVRDAQKAGTIGELAIPGVEIYSEETARNV
jgi:hypothetical protein